MALRVIALSNCYTKVREEGAKLHKEKNVSYFAFIQLSGQPLKVKIKRGALAPYILVSKQLLQVGNPGNV